MSNETSDEKQPAGDYRIGYSKPPVQTRFKKGKSGNPTGRPKGTPNLVTALAQALGEPVVVNEGGQRHTVSKLEATLKQLVNKATLGDPRATQQLLHVIRVLDEKPSEVAEVIPTRASDDFVIAHLIERLSTTTNAEHSDDSQTKEEEHSDAPHT